MNEQLARLKALPLDGATRDAGARGAGVDRAARGDDR